MELTVPRVGRCAGRHLHLEKAFTIDRDIRRNAGGPQFALGEIRRPHKAGEQKLRLEIRRGLRHKSRLHRLKADVLLLIARDGSRREVV